MSAVSKVLIVGAGIGGLTAAIALRQQGIDVDLIELHEKTSVYGVGIIQPNNVLRALDKLGLARACVESGAPFPGWRIHDPAGKVLMDVRSPQDAAPDFPPNNGITRPKLHQILTNAARDLGVPIQFGLTVESISDDGSGVDVRLSNGETNSYDLVIGCDGLHSKTRAAIFGDDLKPTFTGQSVWRYNLPRPSDLEWGSLYSGPDSKVGLVPLSPSLMYMLVVTSEPDNPWFEGGAMAEQMRARLKHFTGHVADLREMIVNPADVVYRPMETFLAPSPWMKGRTLLIGDAVHGTTPHLAQGAAMAIEDAVLLAELLGRDDDLDELLGEFMARRFDRAKFVIDASLQIGAWEMEEWKGIHSPGADPGGLIYSATVALMEPY